MDPSYHYIRNQGFYVNASFEHQSLEGFPDLGQDEDWQTHLQDTVKSPIDGLLFFHFLGLLCASAAMGLQVQKRQPSTRALCKQCE